MAVKHVLLTGAGGFVGHHILEHILASTDWNVTATDSFRHTGITDRISDVLATYQGSSERVQVLTHDLTVPWSNVLISRLQDSKYGLVDTIINLASESHVDRSITDPVPFIQNNVNLMLSMLELARVISPSLFLHLSTDEVYGAAPLGRPAKEWDPILPSNPYSASKAAQEALAVSYWRTYGVPLVILNCMNIIGERQHPEKFVIKTIKDISEGRTVQVHASATGEVGSRVYLHARNLASAMLFVHENFPAVRYGVSEFPDRYNVVGELTVSNLEMAQAIAKILGKDLKYELEDFHTYRPGHDLYYALDGGKLKGLGWTPPMPLMESLEHVVKWTARHPIWMNL